MDPVPVCDCGERYTQPLFQHNCLWCGEQFENSCRFMTLCEKCFSRGVARGVKWVVSWAKEFLPSNPILRSSDAERSEHRIDANINESYARHDESVEMVPNQEPIHEEDVVRDVPVDEKPAEEPPKKIIERDSDSLIARHDQPLYTHKCDWCGRRYKDGDRENGLCVECSRSSKLITKEYLDSLLKEHSDSLEQVFVNNEKPSAYLDGPRPQFWSFMAENIAESGLIKQKFYCPLPECRRICSRITEFLYHWGNDHRDQWKKFMCPLHSLCFENQYFFVQHFRLHHKELNKEILEKYRHAGENKQAVEKKPEEQHVEEEVAPDAPVVQQPAEDGLDAGLHYDIVEHVDNDSTPDDETAEGSVETVGNSKNNAPVIDSGASSNASPINEDGSDSEENADSGDDDVQEPPKKKSKKAGNTPDKQVRPSASRKPRRHVRSVCHVCQEVFKTRTGLQRHMIDKHEGQLAYRCEQCQHQSQCPRDMERHVNTVHDKKKDFICLKCTEPKKYSHPTGLQRHMNVVHGDEFYACTQCPKKFQRKDLLVRHMRSH